MNMVFKLIVHLVEEIKVHFHISSARHFFFNSHVQTSKITGTIIRGNNNVNNR